MKVGLFNIDSKIPNLALMKLSSFHKAQGDSVYINTAGDFSKVYISTLFTKNNHITRRYLSFYPEACVGGTGWDINASLPSDIEHIMPDYALFNVGYSVGYLTRGCIRKCPFCIVPEKEGLIRWNAQLNEFLHPSHDKVLLLDNNLLAYEGSRDILEDLRARQIAVCFTAGLDIRLVDEEKARLLAGVNARDLKFTKKRYYFAFDHISEENDVRSGIDNLLINAGVKPGHMMFYVLTGFSSTLEEDMYRVRILAELGVDIYVMLHEKGKGSRVNREFQRWVNLPCMRKKYSFLEWLKMRRVGDMQEEKRLDLFKQLPYK